MLSFIVGRFVLLAAALGVTFGRVLASKVLGHGVGVISDPPRVKANFGDATAFGVAFDGRDGDIGQPRNLLAVQQPNQTSRTTWLLGYISGAELRVRALRAHLRAICT